MARLPEPVAIFLPGHPAEVRAAQIGADLAHSLRLLRHAGLGPVELEEQGRRDGIVEPGIGVDRLDLHLVEELDARDGGYPTGLSGWRRRPPRRCRRTRPSPR